MQVIAFINLHPIYDIMLPKNMLLDINNYTHRMSEFRSLEVSGITVVKQKQRDFQKNYSLTNAMDSAKLYVKPVPVFPRLCHSLT